MTQKPNKFVLENIKLSTKPLTSGFKDLETADKAYFVVDAQAIVSGLKQGQFGLGAYQSSLQEANCRVLNTVLARDSKLSDPTSFDAAWDSFSSSNLVVANAAIWQLQA